MSRPIFPVSLLRPATWSMTSRVTSRSTSEVFEESAAPQQRQLSRIPLGDVSVSWQFYQGAYKLFRQFGKDDLLHWHRWFEMEVPSGEGYVTRIVRFVNPPTATNAGYRLFKVTASLEFFDRFLPPPPAPAFWLENFEYTDLYPPYSIQSGTVMPFSIVLDAGNRWLNGGVYGGTPIARIGRTTDVLNVLKIRFRFRIVAVNPDDSTAINISADSSLAAAFGFIPMREFAIDAARRPAISIPGLGIFVATIGSSALSTGIQYRLELTRNPDLSVSLRILLPDNTLVLGQDWVGPHPGPLVTSGWLSFACDSGGTTSVAQYDDIYLEE